MSHKARKTEEVRESHKTAAGHEESKEPQTAGAEREALKQELEAKTKEAAELYDRLLRNQAELENFRKRMAKEKSEVVRYATEELINNLLPVLDDLERAVEHSEQFKDVDALAEGIKLVLTQFKGVLEKAGLVEVSAAGAQFDPVHHDAVRVVESDEHQENIVVDEMRKGYILNGRVLRPSMVSVSKKKSV